MIDYMVMEAVFLKAQAEDAESQKEKEITDWKSDKSKLDKFR